MNRLSSQRNQSLEQNTVINVFGRLALFIVRRTNIKTAIVSLSSTALGHVVIKRLYSFSVHLMIGINEKYMAVKLERRKQQETAIKTQETRIGYIVLIMSININHEGIKDIFGEGIRELVSIVPDVQVLQ